MSEKWKVLASDGLDSSAQEILRKHEWLDLVVTKGMSESELHAELKNVDILIIRSATSVGLAEIEAAPQLKAVIRAGVGVDNISREHTESAGVYFWNAPSGNFQAAAEHAVGLMFALARQVVPAATASRSGEWSKAQYAPMGRQLSEATLGLVGAGNIGSRVGKMALGLGMQVIVSDPVFEPSNENPFEKVSFNELLASSDFISIHCPFMPATKNLFSSEAFSKMKKTAFLVNAARGGIIDELALLNALEKEEFQGVALDVFEKEPFGGAHYEKLLKHDRVIATPHLGASTQEAQKKVGLECVYIIEQLRYKVDGVELANLPKPLNGPARPRISIF